MTWIKVIYAGNMASLSDETPADIGTTASEGVGDQASRGDHVHKPGNGCVNSSTMFASKVVTAAKLADDCVNSDQLKAFTDDIDFNGQIASNLCFQNAATVAKPTGVIGKVYYDTTMNKLRICTVVA